MNFAVNPEARMRLLEMKGLSIFSPSLVQKLIDLGLNGQIDPQTVLTMTSITDEVLYHKKLITGASGIYQTLLASDTQANGTRNINNAALPKGTNFFFDEVHLKWAFLLSTDTAICNITYSGYTQQTIWNTAATLAYTNPYTTNNINAGLFNADFEIKAGGNVLLTVPVNEIIRESGNAGVQNSSGGRYKLTIPKLIKELETIEFNLKFGTGTLTAVPETTYIYVGLKGIKTGVS